MRGACGSEARHTGSLPTCQLSQAVPVTSQEMLEQRGTVTPGSANSSAAHTPTVKNTCQWSNFTLLVWDIQSLASGKLKGEDSNDPAEFQSSPEWSG